jgi:hypothetical protein
MKFIACLVAVVIIIIIAVHLASSSGSDNCPGLSTCPTQQLGPGTGPDMPKVHVVDP